MIRKFDLKKGILLAFLVSLTIILLREITFMSNNYLGDFYLFISYLIYFIVCWVVNNLCLQLKWIKGGGFHKNSYFLITVILGGIVAASIYEFDVFFINRNPVMDYISADKRLPLVVMRGALLNWLNAFLVYHFNRMKRTEQITLEMEHLRQANLLANISSLKEQLSPHFLFNTLSTLASLSSETDVKIYVDELSNIYRYLLKHHKNDWVTLREEVGFCNSYLYIIKKRMENAVTINMNIDSSKLDCKIPPVTLQILIENSFKHNIASSLKPLHINIFTLGSVLEITNNIQPKVSMGGSSGIGLNNIEQRYKLLFDQDISINTIGGIFSVKLPLLQ